MNNTKIKEINILEIHNKANDVDISTALILSWKDRSSLQKKTIYLNDNEKKKKNRQ